MKLTDAVVNWWLTNARIKHGHPPADDVETPPRKDSPAAVLPVSQPVSQPEPEPSGIGPITAATIAALGTGATLLGANQAGLFSGPSDKPAAVQPAQDGRSDFGSIIQHLEDNGFHLPPQ